jgi:hypothetical protein
MTKLSNVGRGALIKLLIGGDCEQNFVLEYPLHNVTEDLKNGLWRKDLTQDQNLI